MKLSRMNLKKVTIDALLAAREGDEQQTEGKRERGTTLDNHYALSLH